MFVYPGTDLKVMEFQYNPFYPLISENFKGFTPHQILAKFHPLVDEEFVMVGGKTCYRLCDADGEGFVIPRTLLITCDETKTITGLKICDDQFNLIRSIQLPDNRSTRRLSINMPQIQNGSGWDIVELPNVIIPDPLCPPQPPKPGFLPINPLDPSIFDDVPPNGAENMFSSRDILFNAIPSNDIFDEDGENESTQVDSSTTQIQDVQFVDYRTDNYSNITLSKDDFEKNKKQFIMFEVERV